MTNSHVFTSKLSTSLQTCSQGHLQKGRLSIKDQKGQQWSLYFELGHLVGEVGGVHPVRRWYRQLSRYCPQLKVDRVNVLEETVGQYWHYEFLAKLVRQKQMLREQMVAVVQGCIAEVLFDILQHEELLKRYWQEQLTYTYVPKDTLYSSPLVFIQTDQAWMQAQQDWEIWQQAGLEDYSPNMAPVIWKQEELQQQTSPVAYRSLTTLIDGKRTLRDLALKLKQEPLLLTQSIQPYVRKGLLKLVEVADLSHISEQNSAATSSPASGQTHKSAPASKQTYESTPASGQTHKSAPAPPSPTAPLIVYIDDSPIDSQIMGQILTQLGCRYVNIQDSVIALPTLLEKKPSLIFLDLVMPIANGYEICAQIRRTSMFKDTPVIIVTGNDGIVDRVRAKIVRASDFMAKPIDTRKVLAIIRKYLAVRR